MVFHITSIYKKGKTMNFSHWENTLQSSGILWSDPHINKRGYQGCDYLEVYI